MHRLHDSAEVLQDRPTPPSTIAGTAVGIDVGGTKIAAGLIADGTIVARHRVVTPADPDALLDAIVAAALQVMPTERLTAVGVGYPGMVTADGVIAAGPNVALKSFPLASALSDRIGVPVVVENDAAAATWAEFRLGAGQPVERNLAMITLGTGVGGGLVLDGRLFRGSHGFAAELGHMIIRADQRIGPSGIPGEVEAYCSGTALRSLAVEAVADGRAPEGSPLRDIRTITGGAITQAARAGDELVVALLDQLGHDLGVAMASVVNLLDVEMIVVGGGLGEADDLLLDTARATMWTHVLGAQRRPEVPVVPARLGNDAGVIGAALLAASRG